MKKKVAVIKNPERERFYCRCYSEMNLCRFKQAIKSFQNKNRIIVIDPTGTMFKNTEETELSEKEIERGDSNEQTRTKFKDNR